MTQIIFVHNFRLVIGQYLSPSSNVISHLNITSVQTRDGGLYRCVATNNVASTGHAARINIYGMYPLDMVIYHVIILDSNQLIVMSSRQASQPGRGQCDWSDLT